MLSGEATNTNLIIFGFTRLELEPTIYSTRDVHANYYNTTDAVWDYWIISQIAVNLYKNKTSTNCSNKMTLDNSNTQIIADWNWKSGLTDLK
jgi:hypothetical protein